MCTLNAVLWPYLHMQKDKTRSSELDLSNPTALLILTQIIQQSSYHWPILLPSWILALINYNPADVALSNIPLGLR